jgi:hypothetical protein
MAKELGQIHTVNKSFDLPSASTILTPITIGAIDLPGELTEQLSRMVRAGNYFKTVGIDMSIDLDSDLGEASVLSGFIRYYAPTRGRCEAFRGAFKAMADAMRMQGISMRDNHMYDFKAPLSSSNLTFRNAATLDGTNLLALNNASNQGAGIFQVHNTSVKPTYEGTTSDLYSEGFDTVLASGGARTDFVLNPSIAYSGNEHTASVDYETIPFMLQLSTTADERASPVFQFRPDPALYIAVLCGQFEIVITDFKTEAGLTDPGQITTLNVAVMVSGWKSIMGNPDKKKKTSRKRMSRK